MARTVREARLETRAARSRLPVRTEPYWRVISEGAHLGYYKGTRTAKWVARFRKPGSATGYIKTTLGVADDLDDADGDRFLSFRQAQDLARKWFEKVASGAHRRGRYTIGDVLDEYMQGFRGRSVVATRSRIDSIIRPDLGAIDAYALTPDRVRSWHQSRATSPARLRTSKRAKEPNLRAVLGAEAERSRRATANRDLTVLKAALNRALEGRPDLPAHAWRSVKPFPKVDGVRLRYLSEEEARRLVNATDQEFRPLVQAALLTGARYGELTSTQVSDFDARAATLSLRNTKSGTPRVVYLDTEGARLFQQQARGKRPDELLLSRSDGRRWAASQQSRPLAAACARASLEGLSFHDLRRTYGARLALKGVPLAVIAQALGHADERITRRHYAHLSPSYVSETVRANVAGFGIVPPDRNVQSIAEARHHG